MKFIIAIIISLLLALMLSILPLPSWAVAFRPLWVVLVCLYWVLVMPDRFGLFSVWIVGILLDALNGTLIGEHALALVCVSYVLYKLRQQFLMMAVIQQMIGIFVLILSYQFIIFMTEGFIGQLPVMKWFWVSALVSAIIWPWVYMVMQKVKLVSRAND